jgi:hypothetical protein
MRAARCPCCAWAAAATAAMRPAWHAHTHLAARVLLRGRGGRAQQCQRCRCEGALHHGVLWSGVVGSKVLGARRWGADDGRNSGVRHSGLRTTCGLATRASALKGKFRLETAAPKRSRSALGRHQGSPGSTKYVNEPCMPRRKLHQAHCVRQFRRYTLLGRA